MNPSPFFLVPRFAPASCLLPFILISVPISFTYSHGLCLRTDNFDIYLFFRFRRVYPPFRLRLEMYLNMTEKCTNEPANCRRSPCSRNTSFASSSLKFLSVSFPSKSRFVLRLASLISLRYLDFGTSTRFVFHLPPLFPFSPFAPLIPFLNSI
ncbi:hypothetical protein BGW80DRAFT_503156 [Lactifluus volemus]|nr:hypothetical protein BGW80DRAFT_503156 [Lactifluus volemus]